jgi:hypothetical protein
MGYDMKSRFDSSTTEAAHRFWINDKSRGRELGRWKAGINPSRNTQLLLGYSTLVLTPVFNGHRNRAN